MADVKKQEREREPDAIARDIRETQDDIGSTVDALEEKMTPREIGRTLVGDEGVDIGRDLIDITRRNPVPVAMIALGAIWLLATSRSPLIRRIRENVGARDDSAEEVGQRTRSTEPAPIGPPPPSGEAFDRPRGTLPPAG